MLHTLMDIYQIAPWTLSLHLPPVFCEILALHPARGSASPDSALAVIGKVMLNCFLS